MELARNQCSAFCMAATANKAGRVKPGMGIHHKWIYTSSSKHLEHAKHYKHRVRNIRSNVHVRRTVQWTLCMETLHSSYSLTIEREMKALALKRYPVEANKFTTSFDSRA
jgi:hypothetical protein